MAEVWGMLAGRCCRIVRTSGWLDRRAMELAMRFVGGLLAATPEGVDIGRRVNAC